MFLLCVRLTLWSPLLGTCRNRFHIGNVICSNVHDFMTNEPLHTNIDRRERVTTDPQTVSCTRYAKYLNNEMKSTTPENSADFFSKTRTASLGDEFAQCCIQMKCDVNQTRIFPQCCSPSRGVTSATSNGMVQNYRKPTQHLVPKARRHNPWSKVFNVN